jgi:hypothetical protein
MRRWMMTEFILIGVGVIAVITIILTILAMAVNRLTTGDPLGGRGDAPKYSQAFKNNTYSGGSYATTKANNADVEQGEMGCIGWVDDWLQLSVVAIVVFVIGVGQCSGRRAS